ncbi:MAG: RrF2 family transcriptional regulator [Nitrospinota bacterium]
MIYSKSTEYAIRALAWVALQGRASRYFTAKEIAEAERLPQPILAATLQLLARRGLLESRTGPGGGFRLQRQPRQISLLEVVEAIDRFDILWRCPVGLAECNDRAPCPLHNRWCHVREYILRYLRSTSLEQMGQAVGRKRKCWRAAKKFGAY